MKTTEMKYRLSRLWAWLYAHANAYFWLPCPICKRNFGGHETAGHGIMLDWINGRAVCKNCGDKAKRRNEAWMKANPHPPILYVDRYSHLAGPVPHATMTTTLLPRDAQSPSHLFPKKDGVLGNDAGRTQTGRDV